MSQDLQTFLDKEVVFILFDDNQDNFQRKEKWKNNFKNPDKNHYHYSFYFKDGNKLSYSYSEYMDFDEKDKGVPSLFFKVNKSFLKRNKDIIITHNKLEKIGFKKALKAFLEAKTIFLIDKSETKKGKIILKQVKHFYVGEE